MVADRDRDHGHSSNRITMWASPSNAAPSGFDGRISAVELPEVSRCELADQQKV
jgi:hypothetical protein